MSIEAKHAYRFIYLKSEQWEAVRLEALAFFGGKCQICGEESISNDAHHIWYPENLYETKAEQLVILCRACHSFVHAMLPNCKTSDRLDGIAQWNKIKKQIQLWRQGGSVKNYFEEGDPVKIVDLRRAYHELKLRYKATVKLLREYEQQHPKPEPVAEAESKPAESVIEGPEDEPDPIKIRDLREHYIRLKKRARELKVELRDRMGLTPLDFQI